MKFGLTLTEERYCQLIASGRNTRDAYSEAYGFAITDERKGRRVDKRTYRLMKRPEIAERIAEATGEQRRREREKWERRGEELAEMLYTRIVERDAKGRLLTNAALKGLEVLAKMKGLNAPDTTVLKNGGIAEGAFVPRGVEAMSEADLKAIIEVEASGLAPGPRAARPYLPAGGEGRAEARRTEGEGSARRTEGEGSARRTEGEEPAPAGDTGLAAAGDAGLATAEGGE